MGTEQESITNDITTQAEAAHVSLSASLATARAIGTASLVKAYGAGADSASIALAARAAAVMGGAPKPRGGSADRINKVITGVKDAGILTPVSFASTARAVLDAHKAEQAGRRKADVDARAVQRLRPS